MSSPRGESDNLLEQCQAAPAPEEGAPKKPKKPGPERREITLNLVAMLDMSFQLLVFFVLTVSFAVAEGVLSASLPAGDSAAEAAPDAAPWRPPLNIKLRNISPTAVAVTLEVSGGSIKEVRDCAVLTHELLMRQGRDDDGKAIPGATATLKNDDPVRIAPDADVPWQDVVAAFNATLRAGLTSVGFAPAND
jgi:biopolymer transport protein ExbD